jgi:integrase
MGIQISDTGKLVVVFEMGGSTWSEPTALTANEANIEKARALLQRIESDVAAGRFEYGLTFPTSANLVNAEPRGGTGKSAHAKKAQPTLRGGMPTLKALGTQWYQMMSVGWKPSNQQSISGILEQVVYPVLGDRPVDEIKRIDILSFRAEIMRTRPGRKGNKTITTSRANRITTVLQCVLREASLQLAFPNPGVDIKRLKEPRTDIQPFSLDEVGKLVDASPPIYKDYVLVRCLTGMRSGEINGLQWDHVDLKARLIRVREARVRGEQVLPKSEFGDRDIPMSGPVYDAFARQQRQTGKSGFVFVTKRGMPINTNNFSNRDWPKITAKAKLKARRPYQTRHTAATLMLASGENPEWIAKTLGHADCEMLWKVYSRYVPNMTRRDGSALDAVLKGRLVRRAGEGA